MEYPFQEGFLSTILNRSNPFSCRSLSAIDPLQFGSLQVWCTTITLVYLLDMLYNACAKPSFSVQVRFLDFLKWHCLNFRNNAYSVVICSVACFLSCGPQSTKLNQCYSDWKYVNRSKSTKEDTTFDPLLFLEIIDLEATHHWSAELCRRRHVMERFDKKRKKSRFDLRDIVTKYEKGIAVNNTILGLGMCFLSQPVTKPTTTFKHANCWSVFWYALHFGAWKH